MKRPRENKDRGTAQAHSPMLHELVKLVVASLCTGLLDADGFFMHSRCRALHRSEDRPALLKSYGIHGRGFCPALSESGSSGRGIVNKPLFEVSEHLNRGDLVEILPNTPPEPAMFGCLYPHRRLQDSKVRLFIDYLIKRCREHLSAV